MDQLANGLYLYFEDGSQEYYSNELLHSALKIAAAWRRQDQSMDSYPTLAVRGSLLPPLV